MKWKPAVPGAVIRDPITNEALPESGADVPDTLFWSRRKISGDIVPADGTPTGREPIAPLTTR